MRRGLKIDQKAIKKDECENGKTAVPFRFVESTHSCHDIRMRREDITLQLRNECTGSMLPFFHQNEKLSETFDALLWFLQRFGLILTEDHFRATATPANPVTQKKKCMRKAHIFYPLFTRCHPPFIQNPAVRF